jgi:hypothetical protein
MNSDIFVHIRNHIARRSNSPGIASGEVGQKHPICWLNAEPIASFWQPTGDSVSGEATINKVSLQSRHG